MKLYNIAIYSGKKNITATAMHTPTARRIALGVLPTCIYIPIRNSAKNKNT